MDSNRQQLARYNPRLEANLAHSRLRAHLEVSLTETLETAARPPSSVLALTRRIFTYWPEKALGTSIGMYLFFRAYFWILENPLRTVRVMPQTFVDSLVPFSPETLPFYLSLWLYISITPALLTGRRILFFYGLGALALSLIGLLSYLLFPTAAPHADVDWSSYPSFAFLMKADAAGNAFPSLHVAFAVFSAIWFQRIFEIRNLRMRWHSLNWLWCVAIVYSTMATKQHVFVDVLSGTVLGAGAALVHLRWLQKRGVQIHC